MSTGWLRNSFIYMLIVIALMAVLFTFFPGRGSDNTIPINEVVSLAQSEKIQRLVVNGYAITIKTWDGKQINYSKPSSEGYAFLP